MIFQAGHLGLELSMNDQALTSFFVRHFCFFTFDLLMKNQALKILYADDDIDDIDLLREGLSEVGPIHTLFHSNRGDQVYHDVKQAMPDLIILDYNLPGCDGSECLEMLKKDIETAGIPVVVYSTSSSPQAVRRCYELGAARYLLKPVTYDGVFKGLAILLELYSNEQLTRPGMQEFVIDTYRLPR